MGYVPAVGPGLIGDTAAILDDVRLVALDVRTGTERWQQPSVATFGPVVVGDLFVVAAGTEPMGAEHSVTAFRVDGTQAWTFPEPTSVAQVLSMTAGGGRVFVTEYTSDSAFQLRALDGATGAPLWTAPGGGASAAADVVMVDGDGTATALDAATGQARWHQPGITVGAAGELVIMLDNQEQPPAEPPADGQPIELAADLVARRTADGGEQWRVPKVVGVPSVAGDLVVVARPEVGVNAYRVIDGTPAWQSDALGGGPVAQDPSSGVTFVLAGGQPTGCGD